MPVIRPPPVVRVCVWGTLFAVVADAQTYHWSALAGSAPQSGNADGIGLAARFSSPRGLISTSSGIIYVCDQGNHTIRRIAADGTVTTLAGSPGQRGAADGVGNAARFSSPTGITLSGGVYYIADRANHSIRRMTSTGIVTTFVGRSGVAGSADGSGSNASFNNPAAIDYDSAGNLFVADRENHIIRKITPGGEVSTFAGLAGSAGGVDGSGTTARFNRPSGISVTSTNMIYVADTSNHTIRRITPEGVVTTLAGRAGSAGAGNGVGDAARFRFPHGVLGYASGTVVVADETHAIRVIAGNGTVSTYSGRLDVMGSRDGTRTDARFHVPYALTFLGGGIAVTDSFNQSIRRISTSSDEVTTMAGSPGSFGRQDGMGSAARFNYPNGVAVHESGDIYLADSRGNTIRRISPQGEVVQVAGAKAGGDAYVDGPAETQSLNYPHGIAVASDRTVYFCEQQRHTIRVLHPDGSVSTLAGREGVAGSADGSRDAARFYLPTGLTLDRAGTLIVADYGNHVIRKISVSGEVTTFAGLAEAPGSTDGKTSEARFYFPTSVAIDSHGTMYITDLGNETIRRCLGDTVSTIGGIVQGRGFFDGTGTASVFARPSSIAVDRNGVLYVSEAENNIVRRGEILAVPAITSPPLPVAAVVGGSAVFSVNAAGGGLAFQWLRQGAAIPGATKAAYSVDSVTAAAAGAYSVLVVNALGRVTSPPAALTIVPAAEAGRIVNLSLLTTLPEAGDTFTMGFVVGGSGTTGSKPLVIRAAGPSLGALGVADTLDDPKIELYFGADRIAGNDNWGGSSALVAAMNAVGAFAFVGGTSRDAAMADNFALGNNSIAVAAAGDGTGAVIAEIYDATPTGAFSAATPRLINVSVLKHLGAGLTAGFAVGGRTSKTVLIRAIGPTLADAPFGIGGVVADPRFELFSGSATIDRNDDWGGSSALSAAFARVGAFQVPDVSRDAALLATLPPGAYTVRVKGAAETSGVVLIEIYEVP